MGQCVEKQTKEGINENDGLMWNYLLNSPSPASAAITQPRCSRLPLGPFTFAVIKKQNKQFVP